MKNKVSMYCGILAPVVYVVTVILGGFFLVAEGIFGFITLLFSEDPGGMSRTITGTMHIVFAGLSSLTIMLTILLVGFWFRHSRPCAGTAPIPLFPSSPCFCQEDSPL